MTRDPAIALSLQTPAEICTSLGLQVRARRLSLNLSQAELSKRAGVSYATLRRLESQGKASIEDLVRAAIALRCEDGLSALFQVQAATSIEDLLRLNADKLMPTRRARRKPS